MTSHAKNDWFEISAAAFVNSQKIFRGAVFYPHITGFVGPSFKLFDRLNIRGPNLSFEIKDRKEKYQIELGNRLIIDGPGLISFNKDEGYWSSRGDAFELYIKAKYSFGMRNSFKLELVIAKEVNRHKGEYASLSFRAPLYRFLSITSKTGFGGKFQNQFLYGKEATSGLGHQDILIDYVIPNLSWWKGVIILSVGHHWVLQSENINANLVRNDDKNFTGTTRWIWKF